MKMKSQSLGSYSCNISLQKNNIFWFKYQKQYQWLHNYGVHSNPLEQFFRVYFSVYFLLLKGWLSMRWGCYREGTRLPVEVETVASEQVGEVLGGRRGQTQSSLQFAYSRPCMETTGEGSHSSPSPPVQDMLYHVTWLWLGAGLGLLQWPMDWPPTILFHPLEAKQAEHMSSEVSSRFHSYILIYI